MPPIEKHTQEIHEWIDDPDHKVERHVIGRVLKFAKLFEEKYGDEGAKEYVQHLQDDLKRLKFCLALIPARE